MLKDILDTLIAVPPTALPFLSAYIDLTPELEGSYQSEGWQGDKPPLRSWRRNETAPGLYRPGTTIMRALLSEKGAILPIRGPERESFDKDAARISTYLANEFDPASQGLALFACAGEGIWHAVELPVPVETRLVIDRTPYVSPLAYLEDTYDRYAICLADSQTARVYVVALGRAERAEKIKGPTINYKMTGGLSQRRIQERIANAVSEHIREVSQRLEEIVQAENIPWIILSGDEIAKTEFKRHLSDWAWERVVEVNRLPTSLPEHEAIEQTLETILAAERAEAHDIVEQALDETLSDGLGAAGVEAVVMAMWRSAVDTLILDKEFHATGWRCVNNPSHVGEGGAPEGCPLGCGAAEPVELREELTMLALQTGATVEFVEASETLARMGGIAALLRWRPGDLPNRVAEERSNQ